MKAKKTAALMAAVIMALTAGCGNSGGSNDTPAPAETTQAAQTEKKEETAAVTTTTQLEKTLVAETMATDKTTGSLIMRSRRDKETPMGEDGTWTVFVYLCGADLESEGGAGTSDIVEMIESSANENVRFVVQTGGASAWQSEISADACERYVVQDGDAKAVYTGDQVDMGESSSLADFIQWGLEEYPAANMGLILWDHGSGSIGGVCFDENNNSNSLLLKEIDAALYSVYDQMTEPFEFIGFDACLMSTSETAAVLATHAKYMVASEETEPACGWNYTEIGNFLAENPDCSGAELGEKIADSFYDACAEIDADDGATLSVIDLSRMDAFIEAFNDYSKDIYDLTESGSDFSAFTRSVKAADNFGGNNKSSGYTNMVDIGGVIGSGKNNSENAAAALKALEDAVVYKKNGKNHSEASGLSVYFPLRIEGSQELGVFKDIALSSYYLGLVDKIAYGAANSGEIEGYDNIGVIDSFSNNWSSEDYDNSGDFLSYVASGGDEWSYTDDYNPGSGSVTFSKEPGFDGSSYSFTLDEKSAENTDSVKAVVYLLDAENEMMYELGYSGEVYGDYSTGEFTDGFDGYWFSLPDGQFISAYVEEQCEGYDIYTSPILLNGERTNLRFAYYYDLEDFKIEIIDVWDGVEENGSVSRSGRELKKGDKIVPLYYSYSLSDGDDSEGYFEGEEYKYSKDSYIYFNTLNDGNYMYSFLINDIFGSFTLTDPVVITIEDGEISFEEI